MGEGDVNDAAGDRETPMLDQPPTLDGNKGLSKKASPRWERLLEWVAKNAKPKVYKFPKVPLPKTRWAKSPMTDKDWDEFDDWADTRAEPREEREPPEPPPEKTAELAKLLPRIKKLSKPKRVTPYFVYKKVALTFVPAIAHGKLAKKEKPRKIKKPVIRKCFPNDEVESEFWRFVLKFEVYSFALKYVASERIKSLAKPRKRPPDPHCPIPEKKEKIWPRIKMTHKQWNWHLRRLCYLARSRLPPPMIESPDRGRKKPISELTKRIEVYCPLREYQHVEEEETGVKRSALKGHASKRTKALAQPKYRTNRPQPEKWSTGVKKGALSYSASPRVQEISKPKYKTKKYENPKWSTGVKKGALNYSATLRIEDIAKPKKPPKTPPLPKKRFRKKNVDTTCAIYA